MGTDYFARMCACLAFGHVLLRADNEILPTVIVGMVGVFYLAAGVVNGFLWSKHRLFAPSKESL